MKKTKIEDDLNTENRHKKRGGGEKTLGQQVLMTVIRE